ncbi:MAG: YiiD C-terminal domain-containing protein [Bdellovibrio sp.]|nr:YiiD C-terminal domain-containing protein [Bdellovibrio sp.]
MDFKFSLFNYWPPFFGAGIRVEYVSKDFREVRVQLKFGTLNRNAVGTQFGGSIFAMTDPFYMIMLMKNLGEDYVVWDKAAEIRYRRPGRSRLSAHFILTEADLEMVREKLKSADRFDFEKRVEVKDMEGETVAEVKKVVQIRPKTNSASDL